MPFKKRFEQQAFLANQELIEKNWDKDFQDRKNEIVIIGVDIDKKKIESELSECLLTNYELEKKSWQVGCEDEWPVIRVSPLK